VAASTASPTAPPLTPLARNTDRRPQPVEVRADMASTVHHAARIPPPSAATRTSGSTLVPPAVTAQPGCCRACQAASAAASEGRSSAAGAAGGRMSCSEVPRASTGDRMAMTATMLTTGVRTAPSIRNSRGGSASWARICSTA
jgi:hypothetical protein